MSYLFVLTGNSSEINCDIFPKLELENEQEYVLGLINFESFNSIPNVEEGCNKFYYIDEKTSHKVGITIPTGSYEISDLQKYLRRLGGDTRGAQEDDINDNDELNPISRNAFKIKHNFLITIQPNNNTLHSELKCSKDVDFTPADSIGSILGFNKRKLSKYQSHVSDNTVNILKVNTIKIECNIVTSSYINGKPNHVIHTFFPTVPPGFKIVETPANIIYLPINTRLIDNISLKIVDQNGKLINFRQETVTVTLHLKKL
jgi:hypothetical protein